MNVEYTGRQYEVTNAIRKEVETGLTKIRKILSDRFETKVILAVEKHRHKAEITITPRNGPLVGLAQAKDMSIAVNEALDHLEKQAIKYKTRWQAKKRSARKSEEVNKWNGHSTQEDVQTLVGLSEKTVRNHVSGLLRKLHLRHRTEAALFAAPLKGELNPDR